MRKAKALLLSIICAALAVSFIGTQQFSLMWAFLAPSALFFGLWLYKFQRDYRIIHTSLKKAQTAQTLPPTPSMTSKGSSRLFVPPAIDR